MTHRTPPAFEYVEHDADIGVVGQGPTIEAALEAAAAAVFAIMADSSQVRPLRTIAVSFDEPDEEFALVRLINGLIAEAKVAGLALAHVRIERSGERWNASGAGEPWRAEIDRGVEVKGATLTELSVVERDDGWQARCVVDV